MPARVRLQRMLPSIASVALVAFVMLVLFGPIVLLAVLSFDKATIIALDWQGFTTQWYREMWANTNLRAAVLNSRGGGRHRDRDQHGGRARWPPSRSRRFRFHGRAAWPGWWARRWWCRG